MTFEFNFVLVGLMQIVGFFVQGCTGFGCTVIAAAVTNGLLGTTEGVPYGTLITLPFLYFLGIKAFKEVSWKDLAKIIVLCMPGILVGNYLFHAISPVVAKICIGGMVTFIALMNIYKHIIKPLVLKKNEEEEADTTFKKVLRYGCLILGGVVHGAFNIGGPLITVYTISARKRKRKIQKYYEYGMGYFEYMECILTVQKRRSYTAFVECTCGWCTDGSSWFLCGYGIPEEN